MRSRTTDRPAGRGRPVITTLVMGIFVLGVVTGCGSSNGHEQSSSGGSATAPAAKADLAALYKGTFGTPPSGAPRPASGKRVVLIRTGVASGYNQQMAAAQQAAKALGWSTTLTDGAYDVNKILSGIDQAIASKADAIVLAGVDCASVKTGLEQARQAHIPTVSIEGIDCNVEDPGAPSLFTSSVRYQDGTMTQFFRDYGGAEADWLIAKTGGKGTILVLDNREAYLTREQQAGIDAAFAQHCPACTVKKVPFALADIGPRLQAKVQQALLQTPDASGLLALGDAVVTSGVAAAVQSANRAGKVQLMGGEGFAPNIALIRQGVQDAGIGLAFGWEGYQAIDALVRIFGGADPNVDSGIGLQAFDATHNLPASGKSYEPPVDYRAAYLASWGVAGR